MLQGAIRLQILIGSTLPVPVPPEVLESLVAVEVTNRDQAFDGFKLDFSLGRRDVQDYGLIRSGLLEPPNRVVIGVEMRARYQVLIDGLIDRHQMTPSPEPGQSRLAVFGKDISQKLALAQQRRTHPQQADSQIVEELLSRYAQWGIRPEVTPTQNRPNTSERLPSQQISDLDYIHQLAQRNSFVFYIEPTSTPGNTVAYWGPENRRHQAQPPLTFNMGPDSNLDRPLTNSFDSLAVAQPQATILDPETRQVIPVPADGQLPGRALASRAAQPLRYIILRDTTGLGMEQAELRVRAAAQNRNTAETTGEVNVVRYGHVLRTARLVSVRGVGHSYDGDYYVQQVTHRIQRGQYTQSFSLTREGRGALSSTVMG